MDKDDLDCPYSGNRPTRPNDRYKPPFLDGPKDVTNECGRNQVRVLMTLEKNESLGGAHYQKRPELYIRQVPDKSSCIAIRTVLAKYP